MSRPQIGILGGTFDPVHVGHLVAAVNVSHELGLDRVLLIVANEPWQKVETRPVTPAADRLALVEAAVHGYEEIEASSIEIDRGGVSYTADTVAELGDRYPGAELHLIIGADVVPTLGTWIRLEEIRGSGVARDRQPAGDEGRREHLRRADRRMEGCRRRDPGSRDLEHRPARPRLLPAGPSTSSYLPMPSA